jgi:hypothetical protein
MLLFTRIHSHLELQSIATIDIYGFTSMEIIRHVGANVLWLPRNTLQKIKDINNPLRLNMSENLWV